VKALPHPATDSDTLCVAALVSDHIRREGKIVTITHTAPDADAIGGLLGLTLALRSIGANVTPACSDEVSARFAVMPGYGDIVQTIAAPPDVLIALDCADRERMGNIAAADDWQAVPLVNIDHHVTNTQFGQVNWVDTGAAATSELVLHLIDHMGIALTPDIAINLLHGIVPFALLCLWAKALEAMQIAPAIGPDHARVIWTQVGKEARRACGQADWSNVGLSSFLVSAEEADVSAVIVEKDNGEIDVSLRAKRGFDVSGAAQALGGGGHPLASGTTMAGPLNAAVERVVSTLRAVTRSTV